MPQSLPNSHSFLLPRLTVFHWDISPNTFQWGIAKDVPTSERNKSETQDLKGGCTFQTMVPKMVASRRGTKKGNMSIRAKTSVGYLCHSWILEWALLLNNIFLEAAMTYTYASRYPRFRSHSEDYYHYNYSSSLASLLLGGNISNLKHTTMGATE